MGGILFLFCDTVIIFSNSRTGNPASNWTLSFGGNNEPSYSFVKDMTDRMMHRGPNQTGIKTMERMGMGFNRLSIIDLEDGSQPMANEDQSLWLVFNGEIYNYKSLRNQLENKGHTFRSRSDSEVILHLYEEYEEECLHHLRGMFSFAIWDRRKQRLFVARDPFGIKPFYYFQDQYHYVFASEIKSILAVNDVKPAVDTNSLMHYLTFQYVPQPLTMFQGIRKLEPGHFMFINGNGQVVKKRYWQPEFEPEDRPIETFIEEIRAKLKESVDLHRQSDVARGCFLSGGIDSTAIASYLSQAEETRTFSVGFHGAINENNIARSTANALGTEHHEELISPQQFFADALKAVWHMDEPLADPSAIAVYRLSKLAKRQVTVVLSGEGADELFGGYRIYREPLSLRPMSWIPQEMGSKLELILRKIPFRFFGKNYLQRGLTPLESRFYGNARIFDEAEKRNVSLFRPGVIPSWEPSSEVTRPIYEQSQHLDDITRMQLIDLNLWLPGNILLKADKMSMAHGLELRVPFLDKEVFEVARKIPTAYRISNHTTKYVLRRAMEGIVPAHVLDRPKLGFPVPLKHWLYSELGDIMVEQMSDSGISEWIQMDYVRNMLKLHREDAGDYSRKLWTLYIFSLWHSIYIQKHMSRQYLIV
ncbi:asparagine synthase (glutamine-hydrolyzing) [Cohnella massiliensis]|uniref:asparagine synthase (glutamine-hydrolyzing) n=1 Tax=Cohnella massiliensis TaxID=1816691 RepID=UPI0009BC10DD|nr:asparagine synthase (glutamine-hydrolyzing) [Cohnella massiliensis]